MRDDRLRLVDIQRAIIRIEKYTLNGRKAFDNDELVQTWIVHHLQIIGEACRALSPDFRQNHPEIPWQQIIGMRHILVHHYFGIDVEAVWAAAIADIPALKVEIDALLNISDHQTKDSL
jgi:uncharacterized protein with HEPN domain